ncbi:MAG: hypothetical protein ACR2PL_23670, partial [Dehalococcoidia bacterium]
MKRFQDGQQQSRLLPLHRRVRPSFIEGVARIFDFGQSIHTRFELPLLLSADAAFWSDWEAVARDFQQTLARYHAER